MRHLIDRLKGSSGASAGFYGLKRVCDLPCADEPTTGCLTIENHSLSEFLKFADENANRSAAFRSMLDMYGAEPTFPHLGNFRLGPNMFREIPLDWILMLGDRRRRGAGELIGHGVTTRIGWNGDPTDLPKGWQGTVRDCYRNASVEREPPNTLVGLFIKIEHESREHGWAARIVQTMKDVAQGAGLSNLIIPLRLPTRYDRANAEIPFDEFIARRRDDGEYADHWLRLHVRLGAELLGTCSTSHQHAMHLDDFYQQVECAAVTATGYYVVRRNREWFRAFVDVERAFALIDQECVWVRHAL